jgi:YHS domain-containing protein
MEWFVQNGLWILFAIAVVFMMRRGGMGCGMGGHHHQHATEQPASKIDPVSGHSIGDDIQIASVYKGVTYFFENKENRDIFESNPDSYHNKTAPTRHHGCH